MEAGEKELRKVFEDTTTRNVKAILDHANATRTIVRDLEATVKQLELKLLEQSNIIEQMNLRLATLQGILIKGGTEK